jgi:hypothetical protein
MLENSKIIIEDMRIMSRKGQYDKGNFLESTKIPILGENFSRKFDLVCHHSPNIIGNLNNNKHVYLIQHVAFICIFYLSFHTHTHTHI